MPLTTPQTVEFDVRVHVKGLLQCQAYVEVYINVNVTGQQNGFVGRFKMCSFGTEIQYGDVLLCTYQCTCSGCLHVYVQLAQRSLQKPKVCEVYAP